MFVFNLVKLQMISIVCRRNDPKLEAELWKSTASCRLWIRWTLSTMGRGGSAGQQIRDEILVIMHSHNIKDQSKGGECMNLVEMVLDFSGQGPLKQLVACILHVIDASVGNPRHVLRTLEEDSAQKGVVGS